MTATVAITISYALAVVACGGLLVHGLYDLRRVRRRLKAQERRA